MPFDVLSTDGGNGGGYRRPPHDLVNILDAPPPPAPSLSPDRRFLLLSAYEPYPSIALLARPYLTLGGIRVDPQLAAVRRVLHYSGLSLLCVEDGSVRPITGLPALARLDAPQWSSDGKQFAFTCDRDDGVEIWIGDVETASCRLLPDLRVTDVLAGPFAWMEDNRHLLVARIPAERGSPPPPPPVPAGPVIEETQNKRTQAATYQDLLRDTHDEDLFAFYGTSQLVRVDVETGAITPIGQPDLLLSVRPSPDANYLLVTRLRHPFSYRVPYSLFARTVEVWDAQGNHRYTIADLPVSDEIPQQGVATGPRRICWQEKKPATLLWTEALDGGDPLAQVPHRDRVLTLSAPFVGEEREVTRVTHRFSGWDWLEREDDVLVTEYDRDRRWRTTYRLDLTDPEASRAVLFDLSINDAYNDPGSPVYQSLPNGERTILEENGWIYLTGRGSTPNGDRPFLRRLQLETRETETLFQCGDTGYEAFLAFLDASGSPAPHHQLLISSQGRTQPANFYIHDLATGLHRALTHYADPHPQITGLHKEIVKYVREADGVPLSGTLYLPPGYDLNSGEKLPLLLWAYPEEYSDAATAGQIRGSANTFTRLTGVSPLWFVTQGYAVLLDATVPVVGDPETMNDTFVEQIVGAAKAAIDALDARGLIDRSRVLVAGHSYGAFMTANLLAHSNLFAAGIARSGAYNRTLTPFGFQSERRPYWEARDVYARLSPFTYADQIKSPLLLIHGQADNNSGTYPLQSERFFQALQANGATARLVLLPHESHAYRSRESVLHVLAEMIDWGNRWVKNRPQTTK